MKQNEKILVYLVTGFLFVILAVAVLFGKDGIPRTTAAAETQKTGQTAASLEDLLRGPGKLLPAQEPAQEPALLQQPLATNVQLGPPSPAEEVAMLLGRSRRDRDCRLVTARVGDSLSELVLRWCGSIEFLALAERMNEDGSRLRVGQDVVLPWVDDEEILVALRDREAGRAPRRGAVAADAAASGTGEPVPAAFRLYSVKAGDMLWKIAERDVGARKAPAYIDQVRELNPGLDVNTLRVGQELKLPAKSQG
jgi:hypothetical protein